MSLRTWSSYDMWHVCVCLTDMHRTQVALGPHPGMLKVLVGWRAHYCNCRTTIKVTHLTKRAHLDIWKLNLLNCRPGLDSNCGPRLRLYSCHSHARTTSAHYFRLNQLNAHIASPEFRGMFVSKRKIWKFAIQLNRTDFTRKGTGGPPVLRKFAPFQASAW